MVNEKLDNNKGLNLLFGLLLIIGAATVALWIMGAKTESFIALMVGLSMWATKYLIEQHFREIEQITDRQHIRVLEQIKTGLGYKQQVLLNMYEIICELWKRSIWIAYNWNSLWPGGAENDDDKRRFEDEFQQYTDYLRSNAINIPKDIYSKAGELVEGVNTYKFGRSLKEDPDSDDVLKMQGHQEMGNGRRLIKSSIEALFNLIRDKYGLEQLPGSILDIPDPES